MGNLSAIIEGIIDHLLFIRNDKQDNILGTFVQVTPRYIN